MTNCIWCKGEGGFYTVYGPDDNYDSETCGHCGGSGDGPDLNVKIPVIIETTTLYVAWVEYDPDRDVSHAKVVERMNKEGVLYEYIDGLTPSEAWIGDARLPDPYDPTDANLEFPLHDYHVWTHRYQQRQAQEVAL